MNKKIRTFAKNKALVEERRNQIFRGAAKFFLKKGYNGTSMQELAQYLGMSKMGLYHYIGRKEDIIHLIQDYSGNYEHNLYKQIQENINQLSPTQSLCNAMRLYVAGVDEHQDIHNFLNHVAASMPQDYRRRLYEDYTFVVEIFVEIIQRGIQSGEFREVNASLVAQNIMLLSQAWAHRRWILRKAFTLEEYTKQQIDLVFNSLKNTTTE